MRRSYRGPIKTAADGEAAEKLDQGDRSEKSACTGHLGSERSTSSGSRESRRQSLPPRLGECHAACQCHSGQVEDVDEDAGARNE
ncbi:uncharacterized protein ANIA_11408 [Aspergillus nidulans FGSC A4]|uniref:Uncharacterized protein n=1 Tax=Emericella nidulans (strain FGSC A4 / ATCC 38163 / CBS 112.46 / NRRL 194 / M139) TaxID=227321 RepID=C8V3U0_EMENI|nr:hypothetical protein [Aspergillus nidulans FGSC A4]CBF75651.1 TPA: hypothetical protein ANIA_11408 [Aspergillus nidulans FGSC A4]